MSGLPPWAIRGAKVICISDLSRFAKDGEIVPNLGPIYTIREVLFYRGCAGVRLKEIVNSARDYEDGRGECSYNLRNFRPAVPRSTEAQDLALFTSHLTRPVPSTVKERADVV